jgi:4-diphosphocytidyl-2-C-methyl-D-erythritol kinase
VPVFVRGSSAWGEGRGERLQALELPPRWFLVVHPGVAVSTAEIFQAPELTRNSPLITIRAFFEGGTRNDCQAAVQARYPAVADALDWLAPYAPARLTGTGACIFASFERAEDAERIAARVPGPWRCFVARGLNRSPLHAALFD